jgi:hypothetical protein
MIIASNDPGTSKTSLPRGGTRKASYLAFETISADIAGKIISPVG